ncbi:ATP-binding protein [Nitrososphaera sp. AFS]|jgi:hypothetical protein|nr:ATP-binding protein [Nitrososphaera sp. AFS]
MKVLTKNSNELVILAMKSDSIHKGDYLLIEDNYLNKKMIAQIYDEEYLSSQSLVEDIVRDEIITSLSTESLHDPLNIAKMSNMIRDARIFLTKMRGSIDGNGKISADIRWIPSRVNSSLRRLTSIELSGYLGRDGLLPIKMGCTRGDKESFEIYAEDLDGKLNILTGKKESGKSHLTKILISNLIQYGAFVIVFDLNDEYGGISKNCDGSPSSLEKRVKILRSDSGLNFSLKYCGKAAISNMLRNALETPNASMREFFRIWDWLENRNNLKMEAFGKAVNTWNANELVRDALVSRFHVMQASHLFLENDYGGFRFEDIFSNQNDGSAIVISMGKMIPIVRRMVVELILNKLVDLLENDIIPPIFLFAEEAHMYIRETYWEDIITRMRHFGIYPTFITNQPDAIGDGIYRQADNIFLFNFTNDSDLEKISKVSLADSDTVKSLVKTLPHRSCLIIGKVVSDLPIVLEVAPLDTIALGETKKFFKIQELKF